MARSDPTILQAICAQGLAAHQSGRVDEASELYNRVLRRNPKHADALHLLGTLRAQTGQAEEGASLIRRAIKANPNFPAAHSHLGMALWRLNRPRDALASYDAALMLKPDYADAHNSRGIVLSALGRHGEALASHEAAIALRPDDAEAHFNRGAQLHHLTRHQEALASQERAIALKPDHAQAHNNRGTALTALGRPTDALASYDAAIALRPDYAEAYSNRGVALTELKRLDEALASYDAAIALDPDYTDAIEHRAFAHLLAGQFEAGWRDYEGRKRRWDPATQAFDQDRLWSGQADLDGKRLFLHHEQGLGDTLQFVRYAMLLADRGVDIALSVQTPLASLLRAAMPTVEFLGPDERPASFDYQCSLMSLPHAFGTRLDTIPPPPRYLAADQDRKAHFEALLGPKPKPRIGLAWSGNPAHKNDRHRSMAFERLAPLLSENADWFALQNVVQPRDEAAVRACGRVRFFGDDLDGFDNAAALLDLMDVVITIDTSFAHLAGAMGKPVFVLLPFNPEWRWLLDRDDSPWYPTARLFRQRALGDWASVIEDVRRELRSLGR